MRESGQSKRDYDVMMDNNGCYSPIDHTENTETNAKRTKNLNDGNIQTQVLSPPNSEPVSSCTVINSGSNSSSGSHSQTVNENEEDDKTEVNDTDDNKVGNNKIKENDESVKNSIKKENIDTKDSSKETNNTNKEDESSIKKEEAEASKSNTELADIKNEDTEMPSEHVKICTQIIRNIKRHHDSGPFLKPVDPVALCVPDYFTIIHHPMDISTIESKLKSSKYKNIDEFIDDFSLMFKNCYEYNGTQQPVSLMAKNLEVSFNNQLNHYYHEINNSSEESSQKDDLKINTKSNLSNNNNDDTNTTSKSNRKTGGKTTASKRRAYNNSFYSYLYKKSSSRLMKLSGEMVVCKDVINEILKKRYEHISYPFLHPVDPVALNIPDYPLIIKTPMDISTIQEKLDSGIYLKKKEFEDDFRLIFKNCYQYNPEGTDVYVLGKQLEEIFNEQWNYYNDRYEKSLQAEAEKSHNTNRTTHRKSSTVSHTNTPSITAPSKKQSHTTTHTVAETNITTTNHDIPKDDVVVIIENPPIHVAKKNNTNDHKSQTQHPIAISNHGHATTPKTSTKSKKRSISTTTITAKTKASKTTTTAKTAHKTVKKEVKKKGAGKVVKKRKVSVNEEEEKEVEALDEYDKLNDSDNDERLKLEIEELQKTLQTCTARLSMLLEQKSESLNKKLPVKKSNTTTHTSSTPAASKGRRKASTTVSNTNKKTSRNQKNHKTAVAKIAKSRRGGNRTYEEETYPDYNLEEDIDEIEEEEDDDEVVEVPESPIFYESYSSTKSTKKRGKKRKATAASITKTSSRKTHKKGIKRSNANNVSFSIPSLNMDQKREISDCINKLPAEKMCEVVQIIQESIPLETGQEEIELDIESFDNATLWKLYQFVKEDEKKPRKKNIRKRMKNEVMDQSDSSNILSDSDSDDSSNSSEES